MVIRVLLKKWFGTFEVGLHELKRNIVDKVSITLLLKGLETFNSRTWT